MRQGVGRSATRLGLGALAAGVVAWGGWKRQALTRSGAVGAVTVGAPIFAAGGPAWAAVLTGFFVLSSALSRAGQARKSALQEVAEKGSRRDLGQVLANGSAGALLALATGSRAAGSRGATFSAYLGAIAAVAGDTWATELGSLSPRPPRSILTGKVVRTGVSGGVTPLGFAASAAGGAAMGAIAALARVADADASRVALARLVLTGAAAGLAGSVADSLLGATLQRTYRCPCCGTQTERRVHRCGTPTVPFRGVPLVDNDVVNFLGSVAGAITGARLA